MSMDAPRRSEAWLREYQASQAPLAETPAFLEFRLSRPTLSLNAILKMHWAALMRHKRGLSDEIARQIPPPCVPMERARVTVTRHVITEADADNAIGGTKPLIDCLLVRSRTHPRGLGLIVDDSPAHISVDVRCLRVKKRKQECTYVRVDRMD